MGQGILRSERGHALSGSCTIVVNLYDGSRQPIRPSEEPLLTLRDGAQRTRLSKFLKSNTIRIGEVPVHGNLDDRYTVLASARRHQDAGFFPVPVAEGGEHAVDLMLVHREAAPRFRDVRWDGLPSAAPELYRLLTAGDAALARQQYEQLMEYSPSCLACLLNITTAIETLPLPAGERLLPLFRRIDLRRIEDASLATGVRQDRFFAYAGKALIDIIQGHMGNGKRLFATADASLHPGADQSWKEVRFGEANLQFTVHSADTSSFDGMECVKVEVDMDYYRDLGAHFFLEVVPNSVSGLFGAPQRTDPAKVYALRWMAARNAEKPEEFNPPYTLEAQG